jgi:hypothetical protein
MTTSEERQYSRFDLRKITKTLYDIQDIRKRIEGRLGLKKDGSKKKIDKGDGSNLRAVINEEVANGLLILWDQLKDKEKELAARQKEMLRTSFPFSEVLVNYPGISHKLAGVILSEIDIERATTVSKLWRYCGLDPTAKSVKGEKNKYNKFLKTKLLGTFGHMQTIQKKHPLRPIYDARKFRREQQSWGKSKGHRHNDAIRYVVKMWIANWLYPVWRAFEELEVRPPYQEEYLGHKHEGGIEISVSIEKIKEQTMEETEG